MTKKIALIALAALAIGYGAYSIGATVTNGLGQVVTVTKFAEGTAAVDQAYLVGAAKLGDYTTPSAPTEGYLTIRGTNLVFILTKNAGVTVSPTNEYIVVKAGVVQ